MAESPFVISTKCWKVRWQSFHPANWASSVRLVRNGQGPGPGGGGNERPSSGIRLFDGPNFTGQRFDTQSEIYDLSRQGFNDRASSIAIARGERWQVCMDSNYRSQCQVFDDSVRDLAQYGYFNNSISSVRPVGGGGFPGGPGGPGRPGGNWYTDIDGGVEGIDTMFFPVPEINGRSIDRCMASGGRDCDTAVADAICQEAGYREAAYFSLLGLDVAWSVTTWLCKCTAPLAMSLGDTPSHSVKVLFMYTRRPFSSAE